MSDIYCFPEFNSVFQKELSEVYQSFAESLCSVVSGFHDDLTDKQVLHLADDLTAMDINELYKLVRMIAYVSYCFKT